MNENRRKLLVSMGITLPAAWSRPVVEAIVLPAHAQSTTCILAEDCYNFLYENDTLTGSFFWPGGTGPFIITGVSLPGCTTQGNPIGTGAAVAASNLQEAMALLPCGSSLQELTMVPPLSGCRFFVCETADG